MTVEAATQILEDLSLNDKPDSAAKAKPSNSALFARRRRPWAPRTIPRDYNPGKRSSNQDQESSRKRSQRRRHDSEMSSRHHRRNPRTRTTSEVSTASVSAKEASPTKKLKDTVAEKYEKKGSSLLASYLKNRRDLVGFESKAQFLLQCKAIEVVPSAYRLTNFNIKNTKVIRRILDKFSLQLMFADLTYSRKRCEQIKKLLTERVENMKEMFTEELTDEIIKTVDESSQVRSQQLQERNTESYKKLIAEYNLSADDIKTAEDRLKELEQMDKERHERRMQKQLEKDQKTDEKSGTPAAAEPEEEKKTQE